jgi:hypothetical protein
MEVHIHMTQMISLAIGSKGLFNLAISHIHCVASYDLDEVKGDNSCLLSPLRCKSGDLLPLQKSDSMSKLSIIHSEQMPSLILELFNEPLRSRSNAFESSGGCVRYVNMVFGISTSLNMVASHLTAPLDR